MNLLSDTEEYAKNSALQYPFNVDALWLILQILVTPERETKTPDRLAFNTILSLSQVCRGWRQFILGLPAIWSSVIDFTALHHRSSLFRSEILRRTGNHYPLCVYGQASPSQGLCGGIFFKLLDDHWSRIRMFSVEIRDKQLWESDTLHVFWKRPAPLLEGFHLDFKGECQSLGPSKNCMLFANDAPRLRSFRCPAFKLNFRAKWVKQLREVNIEVLDWKDLWEPFRALEDLTNVESLLVAGPQNSMEMDHGRFDNLPEISLPRLSFISFRGTFMPLAMLLSKIRPGPECRLRFATSDKYSIMGSPNHASLLTAPVYLSYPTMNELTLEVGPDIFSFRGQHSPVGDEVSPTQIPCQDSLSQKPKVDIEIRSESQRLTCDVHSRLLRPIISSCNLIAVTKLRLDILEYYWVANTDIMNALHTLFSSLDSLTELSVGYHGIRLLDHISRNSPTKPADTTSEVEPQATTMVLPSLTKISIFSKPGRRQEFQCPEAQTMLIDFLLLRNGNGGSDSGVGSRSLAPITVLDITEYACWDANITQDKSIFEGVPGLKVICKENIQHDLLDSIDDGNDNVNDNDNEICDEKPYVDKRGSTSEWVQSTIIQPGEWTWKDDEKDESGETIIYPAENRTTETTHLIPKKDRGGVIGRGRKLKAKFMRWLAKLTSGFIFMP